MAMRTGLVRRFLCTSLFSSESAFPAAASASAASESDTTLAIPPSKTLFVSGLNKRTPSEKLSEEFSRFGEVVNATVVNNRATGFSKGYGFVTFSTLEEAEKGMKGMNSQMIDGWVIFAEYAQPKVPHMQVEPYPSKEWR